MHLEELATELGTSSTDLAAAAADLGHPGLTASSEVSPDQVAALRAFFAGAPPAPQAPAGFAGAPPVPPAPQAPPGFAGAPQAPAGFAGGGQPATPPPAGFTPPPAPGAAPATPPAPAPSATPNPYTSAAPAQAPAPGAYRPPSSGSAAKQQKSSVGLWVLLAALLVGLGVGIFIVVTGEDDSDSSETAATTEATTPEATEPPEEVGPTGPDGEPLTQAEKDGLAKMKEAEEANKAKACAALQPISEADKSDAPIPPEIDTFEEAKQYAIDEIQRLSDLYDPAIAALPSQADGMREIQGTYQSIIDAFASATTIDELDARLGAAENQFAASGALDSANELDEYAQANCGFSINQN